jgi:hypothetical protein
MLIRGIWSPDFVSLYPHNLPKKGSLIPEGSHHIQKASANRSIAHEYHLFELKIKTSKIFSNYFKIRKIYKKKPRFFEINVKMKS